MDRAEEIGLIAWLDEYVKDLRIKDPEANDQSAASLSGVARLLSDMFDARRSAGSARGEVQRRVPGGPACPTCGFRINIKAKPPLMVDDNETEIAAHTPSAPPALTADRYELATALAKLDGVTLIEITGTVGDPENANAWRKYLGRADDLIASLTS